MWIILDGNERGIFTDVEIAVSDEIGLASPVVLLLEFANDYFTRYHFRLEVTNE